MIAKQYTDVLSERPRPAEKRRAFRFGGRESEHRVRRKAVLVTFSAEKVTRSAAGRVEALRLKHEIKRSGAARNPAAPLLLPQPPALDDIDVFSTFHWPSSLTIFAVPVDLPPLCSTPTRVNSA